MHRVSEEAMTVIVPKRWRDRAFRAWGQGTSGHSITSVLPAHDTEMTNSGKAQMNRVRHERYVCFFGSTPRNDAPTRNGILSRREGDERFRQGPANSQSVPGTTVFLRARPADSSRVIPASDFTPAGGQYLGWGSCWRRGVPLGCNGCKHATCTIIPSIGRAG